MNPTIAKDNTPSVQAEGATTGSSPKSWGAKWYRYHRIMGLMVMLPLFFWTTSGLVHPLMSHVFKPKVAHFFLPPTAIQAEEVSVGLKEALQENQIASLRSFRMVRFEGDLFYQVVTDEENLQVHYLSASDGKSLSNGDNRYAEYLGRYFLGDDKSTILESSLLTDYTQEYREINRLLPVHKLRFADRRLTDVYIETTSSRYGTINDSSRRRLLWYFTTFHNWQFLDFMGAGQPGLMMALAAIVFMASLSGLLVYGFYWKRFKKLNAQKKAVGWRKYHRQLGLAVAIVTLSFAFSGAYHALTKFKPDNRNDFRASAVYTTDTLPGNLVEALSFLPGPIANISIVKIEGRSYYRLVKLGREKTAFYLDASSLEMLENGDDKYARFLATSFYPGEKPSIREVSSVTSFGGEYGFINKRLPVKKVQFDTIENDTYYIETSTGRLAAKVNDSARKEGFSFAFLHKYHLLDFAGKVFRDIIMSLATLGLLVVSVFGMILYVKK